MAAGGSVSKPRPQPGQSAAEYALEPLRGPAMFLALFLLSVANFMAILDMTIVNVSVPAIAGALGVASDQGTWTITSYAVAEAITVPLTGWLANRFGTVRVFVAAIAGFGVCSFLCGISPNFGMLVVFRVMQGLCGGPMMPLSQTLLMRLVPPAFRAQAMGLWVVTIVVAPIAGPLLGGAITDNMGWEWIFFINVPIAAALTPMAWRMLRPKESPIKKVPIDYVGLGLLIVWIGAMQIMLDKGKDLDWFNSPQIVVLAVIAATGFAAFMIWELTEPHPIVNLKVFRYRNFSIGTLTMCLSYACFFSASILIPLWLQTNMGYTAFHAGQALAFQGIGMVFMAPLVARMIGKVDSRILVSCGITYVAGIMLMRAGFNSNATFWQTAMPQLLQGFGMPFFFLPLNNIALAALKPEEYADGSGLMNFVRTTSAAFGVSIVTTQWTNITVANRVTMVAAMAGDPNTHSLHAPALSAGANLGMLSNLVEGQAVMLATNHMFEIISVLLVFAGMSIWLAPPPPWKKGQAPAQPQTMGH